MTRLMFALAAGALLFASDELVAQRRFFACDLHLVGAAGVPGGPTHRYETRGVCRETDDAGRVLREGWVQAKASYDVKTAMLDENVKVTGYGAPSQTGIRVRCGDDPMITSAKCTIVTVQSPPNAWPDFVWYWKQGKPLTKHQDMYARAVALSKESASAKVPPPPPPPASKPKVALKDLAPAVSEALERDSVAKDDRRQPPKRTTPTGPSLAAGQITLEAGTRILLASGRSLAALTLDGELRWMILGENGEVLRTYPAGSVATRNPAGEIEVDWGGGIHNLGKEKATRLRLP